MLIPLPCKWVSVTWALFKSKIFGAICLTEFKRVVFCCKHFWIVKEKMRWNFDIFIIIACRIKSVLKTMLQFVLTKVA